MGGAFIGKTILKKERKREKEVFKKLPKNKREGKRKTKIN